MDITMFIVVLFTTVINFVLNKQTCDISYDQTLKGTVADCSSRNLTTVPQDLPVNIVALNLDDNIQIEKLTNGMFSSFSGLKSLILSETFIKVLEKDAFHGLHNLVKLDLLLSGCLDNGCYPHGIFDPLRNLKVLNLGQTIFRDEYVFPGYILLPLTKLITVVIEGDSWPNLKKCEELRNLKQLRSLTVLTYSPTILKNDAFICPQFLLLQNLTLSGISHMSENCVFCPLKGLIYLKITSSNNNDITLKDVTRLFYGLINKTTAVNEIDLSGVQFADTSNYRIDIVLDRQVMGYLLDTCVKRLHLNNNRIIALKTDIFQANDKLTMCIEYLDLSINYIDVDVFLNLQLYYMVNLKVVDLSQNTNKFVKRSEICLNGCSRVKRPERLLLRVNNRHNISLPPKLEYLNFTNAALGPVFYPNVTFSNGENLRVLDLSHNRIIGNVQGLSNISYLDISSTQIWESFLTQTDILTSVEVLIAREVEMDPTSLMSKYSIVFQMMTNLKRLDLSGNDIQVINEGTFVKLINVQTLGLSRNQLSYIPAEVMNMPSLISLDLSFNSINKIEKEDREMLDKKLEQQGGFYLNIFGNTIACTCRTLDFVKWLQETRINLENKGNHSCLTEYGTMVYTTQFYNDFLLHWRQCVAQFWLTVAISLILFLIICLMSAFLLGKYFPKVEYQILRWLGMLEPKRWDYEYDAYICYGDKDYQWPCHCLYKTLLKRDKTLELYVPDLHDPFGEVKAEVIHDAIKKSWKLIIVVTEDLFTDEWSHFKVLEALRLFSQEGVITSRILLLYQHISPEGKEKVPNVLLNVIPRQNIMQVNPGDDFWTELHQMIITENMNTEILF